MSDLRDPSGGMRDPADAAIEAQYRAASTEQPGAAADAAILALARTAVAAPAQGHAACGAAANDASWTRRWRAPLALAAGIVLSVGIVTRIQLDPPDDALSRAERASEAAPAVPAPAPVPTPAASQEPAVREAPPLRAKRAAPAAPAPLTATIPESERKPVMPAPSESPATAQAPPQLQPFGPKADAPVPAKKEVADAMALSAAAEARAQNAMSRTPAAASAETPAAAKSLHDTVRSRSASGLTSAAEPVTLLSPVQETQLTPERWITYLIELRQRGEHDAADASLLRFRARHPGYVMPSGAASRQPR